MATIAVMKNRFVCAFIVKQILLDPCRLTSRYVKTKVDYFIAEFVRDTKKFQFSTPALFQGKEHRKRNLKVKVEQYT